MENRKKLTRAILNALLIIVLAALGYGLAVYFDFHHQGPQQISEKRETSTNMDMAVPAFSFTTLRDTTHAIEDFEGKVVLLNFWASWCVPCLKEFPAFMRTLKKYPDDIVLIALSSDLEKRDIKKFLNSKALKMEDFDSNLENLYIVHDKENLTSTVFQTFRLPETLIIGPDQKIQKKLVGANWTQEMLEADIQNLIRSKEIK